MSIIFSEVSENILWYTIHKKPIFIWFNLWEWRTEGMKSERMHVSEYVFKKIEEKILDGEWTPGNKIMSEIQLAKELEVSRMSVREAIEKMVALNILTKKQGEGTYVNSLSPSIYLTSLLPMITLEPDNYLEILEFRLIIEVESAKLCAERHEEETVKDLLKWYDQMKQCKEDYEEFTKADMNFHMTIAEGTKNSLVIKVNKVLRSLLNYHQKFLYKTLGPVGGLKEHKYILEAIISRDAELSGLYMKRHLERTIRDIKEMQNK